MNKKTFMMALCMVGHSGYAVDSAHSSQSTDDLSVQKTSLRVALKALASKKAEGMLGFVDVNKRLQALLDKKLDRAQETEELEKFWSDVNQQRLNNLKSAYEEMTATGEWSQDEMDVEYKELQNRFVLSPKVMKTREERIKYKPLYEAMADTWVEYALQKGMPVSQYNSDHEKFMTMLRNGLRWAYDHVRENLGLIPNELGQGPYSVDNLKKVYADLNKAGYEAVELLNWRLLNAEEDAKLDKTTIANVDPNVSAHDENH